MASRWEGMRVEDIRKRYNIRNDLATEVEMQLLQENKKLGIGE
jgi:Mor family transcriptional regulator